MEEQLEWQDRFNLGVDYIDREHRKLFSIMNKILRYSKEEEKRQWVCEEGIKYFKGHALKHFAEEEGFMASIKYEGLETHRRLHKNFQKRTLPELEKELLQTNYSPEAIDHFTGVCIGWLVGHTLTEDLAIVSPEEAAGTWDHLLPEEEQAAMGEVITHLIYDMFRLDARVISEHYGGEKFGKGIYYRLVYSIGEAKKWEFILVFEERLLLNTIGNMINTSSEKMNAMIMNATRYAARQFVDRVRGHFPDSDKYELETENLLNHEQFQRIFKKQTPQYSLLFDTGAGYFAYCAIAPHLIQGGMGPAINADNAMVEIQEYLDKNEQENRAAAKKKKKILVVDDSMVVRQSMKELLEEDYEITLASSGLATIRCITLNRPDLILLDYEMPVCDGSQVLSMIRSEEEFADIAVIFLTGRVDRESVSKIVPLKPAGYLLKTLKPAEIKKNIDNYFEKTGSLS